MAYLSLRDSDVIFTSSTCNTLFAEGIHFRFQICKKILKSIMIFQSYDRKRTATFFYELQCIYGSFFCRSRCKSLIRRKTFQKTILLFHQRMGHVTPFHSVDMLALSPSLTCTNTRWQHCRHEYAILLSSGRAVCDLSGPFNSIIYSSSSKCVAPLALQSRLMRPRRVVLSRFISLSPLFGACAAVRLPCCAKA